jgi:histidinol phosphatase-like PHP family hydrolase
MFSYLAHPDLPRCNISREAAERLCLAAKNEGVPIECNLLGIKGDRWYPKRDFFQVAAKVGCQVILGADAHLPEAFMCEAEENYARRLLSECGITPVEKLELRSPLR